MSFDGQIFKEIPKSYAFMEGFVKYYKGRITCGPARFVIPRWYFHKEKSCQLWFKGTINVMFFGILQSRLPASDSIDVDSVQLLVPVYYQRRL